MLLRMERPAFYLFLKVLFGNRGCPSCLRNDAFSALWFCSPSHLSSRLFLFQPLGESLGRRMRHGRADRVVWCCSGCCSSIDKERAKQARM